MLWWGAEAHMHHRGHVCQVLSLPALGVNSPLAGTSRDVWPAGSLRLVNSKAREAEHLRECSRLCSGSVCQQWGSKHSAGPPAKDASQQAADELVQGAVAGRAHQDVACALGIAQQARRGLRPQPKQGCGVALVPGFDGIPAAGQRGLACAMTFLVAMRDGCGVHARLLTAACCTYPRWSSSHCWPCTLSTRQVQRAAVSCPCCTHLVRRSCVHPDWGSRERTCCRAVRAPKAWPSRTSAQRCLRPQAGPAGEQPWRASAGLAARAARRRAGPRWCASCQCLGAPAPAAELTVVFQAERAADHSKSLILGGCQCHTLIGCWQHAKLLDKPGNVQQAA